MKRQVSLEEISDGRLYTSNDMVKADCQGCVGCSACCRGMGASVVLDPLDVFRLGQGLGLSAAGLFERGYLEWNVVDGMILPNLVMSGTGEACVFLDGQDRCSVHSWRPGICRMFPLGRYYREDPQNPEGEGAADFRYFLQIHECPKKTRTKVKVRKWIDTENLSTYEAYILSWHNLLERIGAWISQALRQDPVGGEEAQKKANLYVMSLFFMKEWDTETDFYVQYDARREEAIQIFDQGG